MVALQNFELFDIISIVNEKIVVKLFFKITLTVLMSISIDGSQQITHTQEREKQLCHHNIISMVFTLIEHGS